VMMTAAALSTAQSTGRETLRIKTAETAVQVFLDEKEAGVSPVSIEGLAPGPHTLTLVKSGYQDHMQEVKVLAGKPNSVFVVMKKLAAPPPALPVRYRVLHAHSGDGCVGSFEVNDVGVTFQDEKGKDVFQMPWASVSVVSRYLFGGGATGYFVPGGVVLFDIRAVNAGDWANPQRVPWIRVETKQRSYTFFAVPTPEMTSPPSPAAMNADLFDVLSRAWEAKKVVTK
jgi:hypothetical protein